MRCRSGHEADGTASSSVLARIYRPRVCREGFALRRDGSFRRALRGVPPSGVRDNSCTPDVLRALSRAHSSGSFGTAGPHPRSAVHGNWCRLREPGSPGWPDFGDSSRTRRVRLRVGAASLGGSLGTPDGLRSSRPLARAWRDNGRSSRGPRACAETGAVGDTGCRRRPRDSRDPSSRMSDTCGSSSRFGARAPRSRARCLSDDGDAARDR